MPKSDADKKMGKLVSDIARQAADFWIGQLLIYGEPYQRKLHLEQREGRERLRQRIKKLVAGRLLTMLPVEAGSQWFINHLSEPYPPLAQALRESVIPGATWQRSASMSIVYRDGVFDVRTRHTLDGRSTEIHDQYELVS